MLFVSVLLEKKKDKRCSLLGRLRGGISGCVSVKLQAIRRGSTKRSGDDDDDDDDTGTGTGTDWMGRELDGVAREVLSPSRAATRERILLLPTWLRALRPWGDFLQVKRHGDGRTRNNSYIGSWD